MSGKQYPRLMAREKFVAPSDQARTGHPTSRMGEPAMPDDKPNDSTSKADDTSKDDKSTKDDAKKDDPPKDDARKGSDTGKKSDDSDVEDTDWKSSSRRNEDRAKRAEKAKQAAEDEKAAAEQAKADLEAQQAETLDGLAKLLGFKKDDAPPDATKLQETVREREAKLAESGRTIAARDERIADLETTVAARDIELAAWREATKQGVDASMLLNLRSTERSLAALDLTADDFASKLTELIKTEAKDNPALRINAAAAATAADAGIGSAGSGDRGAAATPGVGRLRAAFHTTP